MSRDFDHIMKEIMSSNKELQNLDSNPFKDIADNKKHIVTAINKIDAIDKRIRLIEEKIDHMFEILNNFTIMLEEEEQELDEDLYGNKEWNPYDDDGEYDLYDDEENIDED
jgi:50S ribosomal subunit-associated GTPase HflX